MLQYFSKEFFAPIIITAEIDKNGQLQVYTVCDTVSSVFNSTALIYVYNYNSLIPVSNLSVPISELVKVDDNYGVSHSIYISI